MDDNNRKRNRYVKFVILSVMILTIISLNFSYSAFFSIDSRSTVQEIDTGTLNVTASATPMAKDDLFPTEETLPTDEKSTLKNAEKDFAPLTITNNGNIDANFVVSLSYDEDSMPDDSAEVGLVSFDNLIVGVYDVDNTVWLNLNPDEAGDPIYNMKVTQFTESAPNVYPILKGEIDKATMDETNTKPVEKNLRVYIWLADTTPATEIGKYAYLKLEVKSTPISGQDEQKIEIKSDLGE